MNRRLGDEQVDAPATDVAEPKPPAATGARLSFPGGAALLLAITLIAYIPALFSGYIWDDDSYLTANPVLRHPDGLRLTWTHLRANPQYYPMVFTMFWLEMRAWGLHPFGYHAVNVLLHAASAILLWRLLRRLEVPWAWLAAAIFAVHPVHAESVAWITERKNTLSLLFYLAALSAYLRFSPLSGATEPQPRRWSWYPIALLLFAAALLSKTVTCSLPAALVLLIWWKRARVRLADLWPLAPMFAMGLAAARVTSWLEHHHVRAKDLELGLSPVERVLIAGRATWFYFAKLAAPLNQTFIYPKWKIDASAAWQYAFPAGVVLVLAAMWLARHRLGRGPLIAALLYVGTLLPALGFVDVYPFRYSWVADHFQYHASIAMIAALVAWAYLRRMPAAALAFPSAEVTRAPLPDRPAALPTTVLLGVLCVLTFIASLKYLHAERLWRDTLARNESAWIAHNNLGALLSARGQFEEAEKHLRRSLELNQEHSQALNNLAYIALAQGQAYKAIELCERAMAVRNAELREVYNNYGLALSMLRRYDEAVDKLGESIRIDRAFVPARINLAKALLALERYDDARVQLDEVQRLRPRETEPYLLWGESLAARGRNDEALAQYEAAVKANSRDGEARFRLARALDQAGRAADALPHAAAAAWAQPRRADVRALLGRTLRKNGKYGEAIDQLKIALQIDSHQVDAYVDLGEACLAADRGDEAVAAFDRALSYEPDRPGVRESLEAARKKAGR